MRKSVGRFCAFSGFAVKVSGGARAAVCCADRSFSLGVPREKKNRPVFPERRSLPPEQTFDEAPPTSAGRRAASYPCDFWLTKILKYV